MGVVILYVLQGNTDLPEIYGVMLEYKYYKTMVENILSRAPSCHTLEGRGKPIENIQRSKHVVPLPSLPRLCTSTSEAPAIMCIRIKAIYSFIVDKKGFFY